MNVIKKRRKDLNFPRSTVKSIIRKWKKICHNPDTCKIRPSFQIEHTGKKGNCRKSVQEARARTLKGLQSSLDETGEPVEP